MKNWLRSLAMLLTAAVLVSTFSACASEKGSADVGESGDGAETIMPDNAGASSVKYADQLFSLNFNMEDSLNPYLTGSRENLELAPLMYEGMFAVNEDFSYSNVLCEDFSTEDGKVYRFSIKQGVKLHDGSELTPEDVACSIEAARTSDNYSARLSVIAAAYVIENAVYVELTRPNYNLPMLLDIPIVKKSSEGAETPVGTGAYYYVNAGEYRYLKAFDEYRAFGELPTERIYLKSYERGEQLNAFDSGLIDLAASSEADIGYLAFGGNTEVRRRNTTVLHFLGINRKNGFLADNNRRILFSSMIDRDALVENTVAAVPTTLPLHPSAYFASDSYDGFTIRRQELADAGIQYLVEDYDADGMLEYMDTEANSVEEIALRLIVNKENPAKVAAAEKISEDMNALGIAVTVEKLSWSGYIRALRNGNYDLYYGEVMLTADFDLTQLLCYGGSANCGLYDQRLQSLIYAFNASAESEKQDAAAKLYSYIAAELPIISLMFEIETVYTHRETVSGMNPTIHNIFNDITKWSICIE